MFIPTSRYKMKKEIFFKELGFKELEQERFNAIKEQKYCPKCRKELEPYERSPFVLESDEIYSLYDRKSKKITYYHALCLDKLMELTEGLREDEEDDE